MDEAIKTLIVYSVVFSISAAFLFAAVFWVLALARFVVLLLFKLAAAFFNAFRSVRVSERQA